MDYFKRQGHSDRVIAVIIDGEPNASLDAAKQASGFNCRQECFPRPLQFEYDSSGKPSSIRAEPVAADFRIHVDGNSGPGWTSPEAYRQYLLQSSEKLEFNEINQRVAEYRERSQLMLLKIVAAILGLPLGQLTQRDKAHQLKLAKEKTRRLRAWLVVVGVFALIAASAAVYAMFQTQLAKSRELAARADQQLELDPLSAANLALSAYDIGQTEQAEQSIRRAVLRSPLLKTLTGAPDRLYKAVFTPNDSGVLARTSSTTFLWERGELHDLEGVFSTHHGGRPRFSADKKRLALNTRNGIKILNTGDWSTVGEGFGHWYSIDYFSLDSTGKKLAILGLPQSRVDQAKPGQIDFDDKQIEVWDTKSGELIKSVRLKAGPAEWKVARQSLEEMIALDKSLLYVADAVDFSDDGQTLLVYQIYYNGQGASRYSSARIRVLSLPDMKFQGERPLSVESYPDSAFNLAIHPQRHQAASIMPLGRGIEVWHTKNGELIAQNQNIKAESIAWSSDGQRLVTTDGSAKISIWIANPLKLEKQLIGRYNRFVTAYFSDDSSRVIAETTAGGAVSVWDTTTGVRLGDFSSSRLGGGDGFGVSGNGRFFLDPIGNTVQLLALTGSGERVITVNGKHNIQTLQWLKSDGRLYALSESAVMVWNQESDQFQPWLSTSGGRYPKLFDLPNRSTDILVWLQAGRTKNNDEVCQVNLATALVGHCIGREGVTHLDISSDGKKILLAQDLKPIESVELVGLTGLGFKSLAKFDGDFIQARFLAGNQNINVWNSWNDPFQMSQPLPKGFILNRFSLGISPYRTDQGFVFAESDLWYITNESRQGQLLPSPFHLFDSFNRGNYVAVNASPALLAAEMTSDDDYSTRTYIWDLQTRKLLHDHDIGGPFEFSPDGALLAYWGQLHEKSYETVSILEIASGDVIANIPVGTGVDDLEFSPDSRQLGRL